MTGPFALPGRAQKKPRVSGAEVGGTSDEPHNAVRSTNRRLARPIRICVSYVTLGWLSKKNCTGVHRRHRNGSKGAWIRTVIPCLPLYLPQIRKFSMCINIFGFNAEIALRPEVFAIMPTKRQRAADAIIKCAKYDSYGPARSGA